MCKWCRPHNTEPGAIEPLASQELTLKKFTSMNTTHMVSSATGEKLMSIKREAVKGKATQMLSFILVDASMTTHACTLPVPYATLPPGVGKACPTIWGEGGENGHDKVSAE